MELAQIFKDLGVMLGLVVVLLYWVFFLQKKLISIIENNTQAMVKTAEATAKNADAIFEIKNVIRDCPANSARRTS